jgi:NAD(P)-dependent dehydrogenase (short-subunit alcohol dehydrogenase family)
MRGPGGVPLAVLVGAGAGFLLARGRSRRVFDFSGRIVLLTGGSRGLGLVLARELLREGVAALAICARDPSELERARRQLETLGGRVLAIPADVTDRGQVEELVLEVSRKLGPIDVLINNAGTIAVGSIDDMTVADFDEAMRTNFWASLYTILAVLPEMRRREAGRIVNIASIGGKLAVPHLVPYSASKFALVGLSEGMRAELARYGIVVTTICPGLMRTGSPRNAFFKGQHRAEYTWFSISDALPGASMSAERAARRIISACRRGEAEAILSLPAGVAARLHALAPEFTAAVLGVVNRLLPGQGGIGQGRAKGKDSESGLSPSLLTVLGDRAARRNNQVS